MKLLRRSAVKEVLQADIDELIKTTLPTYPRSSLESIGNSTKCWITERTAYAIFSHRWLSSELTFDDVRKFEGLNPEEFHKLGNSGPRVKAWTSGEILDVLQTHAQDGYEVKDFELLKEMKNFCGKMLPQQRAFCPDLVKLIEFCEISRQHGCNLVWFDTGCIDKTRSAELEESIRSMYNWYRRSKVCIVHLADTTSLPSLERDAWFTRGWTLQELLAPKRVIFFGASWHRITPHRSQSDDNDKVSDDILGVPLWKTISTVTKISVDNLLAFSSGITHARDALVWASKRRTTRIEDIAYCLIGLLDIPLSIAYGEGHMAFYRLQVEIMQRSPDIGLFGWVGEPSRYNTMLAARVDCFSPLPFKCNIEETQEDGSADQVYMLTNRGLRISLPIYAAQRGLGALQVEELGVVVGTSANLTQYDSLRIAVLNGVTNGSKTLAIALGSKKGRWTRIPTEQHIVLRLPDELKEPTTLYIK